MKKYSPERYEQLVEEIFDKIKELARLKGGEYSGDVDRLANFRRNGEAQGLAMEAIWGVYAAKHWDAIMQYVKDINTGKTRERMEPIEGRAHDLIVYLCLFCAMVDESSDIGEGDDEPKEWVVLKGFHQPSVTIGRTVEYKEIGGLDQIKIGKADELQWSYVHSYKLIPNAVEQSWFDWNGRSAIPPINGDSTIVDVEMLDGKFIYSVRPRGINWPNVVKYRVMRA